MAFTVKCEMNGKYNKIELISLTQPDCFLCRTFILLSCVKCDWIWKSLHLCTKSEFNFIAQDDSYTQYLSLCSLSAVQC